MDDIIVGELLYYDRNILNRDNEMRLNSLRNPAMFMLQLGPS